MWKLYRVKMNFTGRLCGSVPLSKELVRPWLEARAPAKKPENGLSLEEIMEEVASTIKEEEEKITLGFQSDEKGLFVRGGTIKAHLKDCANQIKDVIGIKNFRNKVANKIHVEEYRVYLKRNGGIMQNEDDQFDQPVHVMTAQGPRNALKTIRFAERPALEFHLRALQDKEITGNTIRAIFDYGSYHGYGGERGMGEGRYEFTIEEIPLF